MEDIGNLYKAIIEDMSSGLLIIGEDARIILGNASVRRFLGMSEDIEGKTLAEAFFKSECESYDGIMDVLLDAVFNNASRYREPVDVELSGEKKHYLISSYGISLKGKNRAAVLVAEDITELSELRDAVKATQKIHSLNDSIERRDELIKKTYGEYLTDERVEDILTNGTLAAADDQKKVIVSLRGVTKEYPSGESVIKVLKGIDLDIYEHEFLVILGESGCGKSTMMNIIGGMDFLTDGSIVVEGRDISHPDEKELTQYRRDYVGFVFQSYNLMPNLTAKENVEFIAEISQNPISADEAIEKVGLSERASNYPSQMSGGQQQRVSIARALVKNPTLILADEPTAALDFATSQEVLSVIEDVVRNQGKTVVMITHNDEIGKMADRVVRLKDGKVSAIRVNLHPLSAKELLW